MPRDDDDRVEPMLPPHAGGAGSDTPVTDQFIYLLRHRPRVIPYLARVLRTGAESGPSSPVGGETPEPGPKTPPAPTAPTLKLSRRE